MVRLSVDTTIAPYYNADCSSLSNTTWVATVVGAAGAGIRKIIIEGTVDKPLEFGFSSGTGNTAAFYFIGTPHTLTLDLDERPLEGTLYVRKLAGGSTPTASTVLAVSALP